ncbi:MAG TPA: hypothetical protein VMY35_14875 [Phycisphaerae bacterium]|nr:hypothetical protein [Phycisphaerae bacterium]
MLDKFTKTPHCRREMHCGTCRDLEGGRAWRKQIAERFTVEGVDWPCPKGHDWEYEPPEERGEAWKSEPAFVAARRIACRVCDEEACFLKRMLNTKPCAFRARIVRPGMVCPLERWA